MTDNLRTTTTKPAPMTAPKPAQPVAPSPAPTASKTEAPPVMGGAVTVDFIDAEGWTMSLTVTAASGIQAIEASQAVIKRLKEIGMRPKATTTVPPQANNDHSGAAPICGIHHKPMSLVKGPRGPFYSCHEKLEDGSFCPYKPAK